MWMVIKSGVLVLSISLGAMAAAEEAGPQGVIQDQLNAFMADDFDTAFTFASPSIRNIFRNSANFGAMVREGYPMVWRPADVRFGAQEQRGAGVAQRVIITDADGAVHVLEYEMIPGDGGWKINGVRILQAPGVGA